MKITKSQLKRIIQEETENLRKEGFMDWLTGGAAEKGEAALQSQEVADFKLHSDKFDSARSAEEKSEALKMATYSIEKMPEIPRWASDRLEVMKQEAFSTTAGGKDLPDLGPNTARDYMKIMHVFNNWEQRQDLMRSLGRSAYNNISNYGLPPGSRSAGQKPANYDPSYEESDGIERTLNSGFETMRKKGMYDDIAGLKKKFIDAVRNVEPPLTMNENKLTKKALKRMTKEELKKAKKNK